MADEEKFRLLLSPWEVLESRYSFNDDWVKLRSDKVRLPNNKVLSPYHTFEFPDWVTAVVLTPTLNIVLVEQYRHGAKQAMTELPAGAPNSAKEEPLIAMKRELLEETGYASDEWHHLGSYFANGARLTNRVHAFLAINARKVSDQKLDEGELIRTHEIAWTEFTARFTRGDLPFAACQIACLYWLQVFLAKTESELSRSLSFPKPA